jgi:hypothetical protein
MKAQYIIQTIVLFGVFWYLVHRAIDILERWRIEYRYGRNLDRGEK